MLALFPSQALQWMGAAPAVVEVSTPFMRLVAWTLPLHLLAAVAAGTLRSLGDTRTPMLITLGSVGINTGLSFLLVFGAGPLPALGVTGAALATLASCMLRVLALAAVVASPGRQLVHRAAHLVRPARPVLLALWRLSWPMALVELFWTAGLLLYALMCTRLGTREIVAWQISNTVEGAFIMLSSGLAVAGLTLAGQQFGVGDVSAARSKSWEVLRLGLQASILFGLLAASGALWLRQLYPEVTGDAMRLAVLGLVLNALFQPAKVLNMILGNGVLRAGGDTRFILAADTLSIYAVGLPLALLLAFPLQLGFAGVLAGRLCEELARLALYLPRYRTAAWHPALAEPGPPGRGACQDGSPG
jgi:putative MATE family efflux protein